MSLYSIDTNLEGGSTSSIYIHNRDGGYLSTYKFAMQIVSINEKDVDIGHIA